MMKVMNNYKLQNTAIDEGVIRKNKNLNVMKVLQVIVPYKSIIFLQNTSKTVSNLILKL
ncbi:MAG: hypothetical protein MAG458_00545 [Nitrosopumilus sp.]|nr:hypothetical protein [Nitrosopumilus sp.]